MLNSTMVEVQEVRGREEPLGEGMAEHRHVLRRLQMFYGLKKADKSTRARERTEAKEGERFIQPQVALMLTGRSRIKGYLKDQVSGSAAGWQPHVSTTKDSH